MASIAVPSGTTYTIPTASNYDSARRMPLNYNDERYKCCCNTTHVERGAYIIAFVGALLSAVFAVVQLLAGNIVFFVTCLISFLIYWSILYAQKKRSPGLYWPFLVLNAIGMFLMAIYIIFLVVMLILLPDFWTLHARSEKHETRDTAIAAIRLFTWLQLIYSVISQLVTIFFWSVVYRAYKFMKEEQSTQTILRKV